MAFLRRIAETVLWLLAYLYTHAHMCTCMGAHTHMHIHIHECVFKKLVEEEVERSRQMDQDGGEHLSWTAWKRIQSKMQYLRRNLLLKEVPSELELPRLELCLPT